MDGHCSRDLGRPGLGKWVGITAIKVIPERRSLLVQCLGQEDPLEKGMATHSRILAWEISWTEEAGGLQSLELQRVGDDLTTKE